MAPRNNKSLGLGALYSKKFCSSFSSFDFQEKKETFPKIVIILPRGQTTRNTCDSIHVFDKQRTRKIWKKKQTTRSETRKNREVWVKKFFD